MVTAEITGAFLQKYDTSGSTHLKFDGMMAELLAHIDQYIHREYINTDQKGCKIMYTECLKDLCGTTDAALLFWVKVSTDLERWGFRTNRYNWCVMNKDIKGKQCTTMWHV